MNKYLYDYLDNYKVAKDMLIESNNLELLEMYSDLLLSLLKYKNPESFGYQNDSNSKHILRDLILINLNKIQSICDSKYDRFFIKNYLNYELFDNEKQIKCNSFDYSISNIDIKDIINNDITEINIFLEKYS